MPGPAGTGPSPSSPAHSASRRCPLSVQKRLFGLKTGQAAADYLIVRTEFPLNATDLASNSVKLTPDSTETCEHAVECMPNSNAWLLMSLKAGLASTGFGLGLTDGCWNSTRGAPGSIGPNQPAPITYLGADPRFHEDAGGFSWRFFSPDEQGI